MKFIALEVPMPWPHDLKTGAEIDQLIGGTPPAEFAADMTGLGTLFQRFVSDPGAIVVIHPFFGTMSERDWLRWAIFTWTITCASSANSFQWKIRWELAATPRGLASILSLRSHMRTQ